MSTILANKVSTLKTGRPLKKEAPSGKERPPWRSRPIRNFLAPRGGFIPSTESAS